MNINNQPAFPAPSFGLQYARSLVNLPMKFFDGSSNPDSTNPPADDKKQPDTGGSGGPTQEELDRQFADRAKRAAEAERKKMLESLGVKDETELKSLVETQRKADEARKSELEKLADRATKAEEKASKLESESAQRLAEMQKRLLDSEVKMQAARSVADKEGKITRPAFRVEALDDILLLIDRSKIEDKDGKYDGVDKALAELAKAKPYLLDDGQATKQQKGTPIPGDKKNVQKNDGQKQEPVFFTSL